ncbi:hypothetical protein FRC11_014892, partial [Ceratobasidium sp. 423]
ALEDYCEAMGVPNIKKLPDENHKELEVDLKIHFISLDTVYSRDETAPAKPPTPSALIPLMDSLPTAVPTAMPSGAITLTAETLGALFEGQRKLQAENNSTLIEAIGTVRALAIANGRKNRKHKPRQHLYPNNHPNHGGQNPQSKNKKKKNKKNSPGSNAPQAGPSTNQAGLAIDPNIPTIPTPVIDTTAAAAADPEANLVTLSHIQEMLAMDEQVIEALATPPDAPVPAYSPPNPPVAPTQPTQPTQATEHLPTQTHPDTNAHMAHTGPYLAPQAEDAINYEEDYHMEDTATATT